MPDDKPSQDRSASPGEGPSEAVSDEVSAADPAEPRRTGAGGSVPPGHVPPPESPGGTAVDTREDAGEDQAEDPSVEGERPLPITRAEARRTVDPDAPPDPAHDIEQRKIEAGVEERFPFGRPGLPLGKAHPFVFGFTAALGVI
ncbi:hypothetical protein ACSNOI_38715, partial [Actinomadura kijaniata]